MKNRLIWKLLISFGAVLLLFALIMGGIFLTLFKEHMVSMNKTDMERKAVSVADTLSGFQNQPGEMGHGGGMGAYCRFLDELTMEEVWIVDENLNFLTYGHGRHTTYESLPANAEKIVQRVFAGEVTYGEEFSDILSTPTMTVGAPILRQDGMVVGAVLLHSPVSGALSAVRQGGIFLAIGVGIALLFASGAAFFLAYILTKPLNKMKQATLRLAEGDYSAQTDVRQQDEIGQLAFVLNLLSGRLLVAEEERAALDKLREDFVTNVSHELRTPVAVLRGSLEVLRDGTVSQPAEIADYYEQMLLESKHLERLVNDLLELSRLEDAGFVLEMDEVNLCDVVRDVSRSMRRLANEKAIRIETDCPLVECMVSGDYGRLRQMLLILMDNAIKFSPHGGQVVLGLKQEDGVSTLSITDYGSGIPEADLPFVFERFKKAHSPENKSGTGLGLAIAKEIADRHCATLVAKSDGETTIFTIMMVK